MVLARICVHACLHTHRHMLTFFLRLSGMGNPEIAGRLSKQIEVEQQYIHVYPNMTAAWARSDMYLISMYTITHMYTYI